MKFQKISIWLASFMMPLSGYAAESKSDTNLYETNQLSLAEVVNQVLHNNPSLTAARQQWQALQQRPEIVRALPDPMLTYGYWLRSVETRVGANNNRLALSQKFPLAGKRTLAGIPAPTQFIGN